MEDREERGFFEHSPTLNLFIYLILKFAKVF